MGSVAHSRGTRHAPCQPQPSPKMQHVSTARDGRDARGATCSPGRATAKASAAPVSQPGFQLERCDEAIGRAPELRILGPRRRAAFMRPLDASLLVVAHGSDEKHGHCTLEVLARSAHF